MKVRTALISVSDKTGLVEFARELERNGVRIISSGGTFNALQKEKVKCEKVESVTGFPEMLDGRLKTLHPLLHGGILAKRDIDHLSQLKKFGIPEIDLVVVNLYPFRETVSESGISFEQAIETIDIGGPALIRGAAKNHESVGIIVEPAQYRKVLRDLKQHNFDLSEKMRKELAVEAFRHTAFYDSVIVSYLELEFLAKKFPEKITIGLEKKALLRYGENPHQKAALYESPLGEKGIAGAKKLSGKELSYNNYLDADAAVRIVAGFEEPCAVIVKHGNPCGAAVGERIPDAFRKALECDSKSAFGGVIALNAECNLETAKSITSFFNEVVVAPSFEKAALAELGKKNNLRVLQVQELGHANHQSSEKKKKIPASGIEFRQVSGGMLAQESDMETEAEWKNMSGIECGKNMFSDLEFAWKIVKHVKSNAIVIAKGMATIGIGMGLTSRVDAAELAIKKAGGKASSAVLASDGFFPFGDSIELAARAGIKAIAEPGGSVKDSEVIEEAKKQGIALYFTGTRHFRH